jgi:IstB-like ATP binding protein
MGHGPARGAIIIMLRSLKMHGMAQAVGEPTEQGSPAFEAALPILSQLLKAETADREVRSTPYQAKAARFPNHRDLMASTSSAARSTRRCCGSSTDASSENTHKVILVGNAGTRRISPRRSASPPSSITSSPVRFFSTVALEKEKLQGKPRQIAARPAHSDLIILVATCRSAPPAGRCSSISRASSTSAPASLSRPISASASGPPRSAVPKPRRPRCSTVSRTAAIFSKSETTASVSRTAPPRPPIPQRRISELDHA